MSELINIVLEMNGVKNISEHPNPQRLVDTVNHLAYGSGIRDQRAILDNNQITVI